MKDRITLRHGMLPDFQNFLTRNGWKLEETKGMYEVLRARHPNHTGPLLVYDRASRGCGYSINQKDMKIYKAFFKDRAARGLPQGQTQEELQAALRWGYPE